MIYFLHGTDTEKARAKAHELIDFLLKKKPDVSFFKMDAEHFSESQLQEYSGGQGLFENKYIVFLDRICEDKNLKEAFLDLIKEVGESDNIFIILEGKLDKTTLMKIEKQAQKTQEFMQLFTAAEKAKKEEYNAFALADAIGNRDRKNAWILYRTAVDKGEAPEALHGIIFWKIKTIMTNSIFSAYSKEEAYALSNRLVTVYHDSRRGMHELETGLETLILSL